MSLREIAKEAGVSVTTVSRIVNGTAPNKVSEETRRRVLDIARSMRYRPNQQAVALVKQRPPNTLALAVPYYSQFFRSFYFSEISCGVLDVANARAMDVNVVVPREPGIGALMDIVAGGRVGGLILLGAEIDEEFIGYCRAMGVPVVVINNNAPSPGADSVDCDNRTGAREMTRHLLHLGHTRIAYLSGVALRLDSHERFQGYRDALEEAGLVVDEALTAPGEFSEKGGRDAMRALLARGKAPTAVFAANDQSAIGAMQVLKREGFSVPEDVAVAGFDDIPIAQYVEPPLTTVHQPMYRLGEAAAEVLIARMNGQANGGDYSRHILRTRLVIRESCGARRAAHEETTNGRHTAREERNAPDDAFGRLSARVEGARP